MKLHLNLTIIIVIAVAAAATSAQVEVEEVAQVRVRMFKFSSHAIGSFLSFMPSLLDPSPSHTSAHQPNVIEVYHEEGFLIKH